MAQQQQSVAVVFALEAGGGTQLTCCIHALGQQQQADAQQDEFELLVVDAAGLRGWSTRFSTAAVNTALSDEYLSSQELGQVLAAVLPCQGATSAVLGPGGSLRLEGWCHRTQRLPLLPPTAEQRAQPDSDYRQAAFCISLPVSRDLSAPTCMAGQRGEGFAAINAGLLAALLHRDQQLQDSVLLLQSQLRLLHAHTSQLAVLADRAVRTAVRGSAGLKELPKTGTGAGAAAATSMRQQATQQQGTSPGKAAATRAPTRSAPGPSLLGSPSIDAPQAAGGLSSCALPFLGSQAWGLGAAAAAAGGGSGGGVGPQGSGGAGGSSRPAVERVGSGGALRPLKGAAAGGGRAHVARQSQDEQALRQMYTEQQGLLQAWNEQLRPLLRYAGPLQGYEQLCQQLVGTAEGAAVGRQPTAQPWHLGQQQQRDLQQQRQGEQAGAQEGGQQQAEGGEGAGAAGRMGASTVSRSTAVVGAAAAAAAAAGLGAAGGPAADGDGGPSEQCAVVAPVKQRAGARHTGAAAGLKRAAEGGAGVLGRGKRRR